MSMSLRVSAQRRAEPATSTRSAAGCSAATPPAPRRSGGTLESSSRAGALARLAQPLQRGEDVSSAFGRSPLRPRIRAASAAARRSSTGGDSELVVEAACRLRLEPRTRVTSISVVGNFAFSFAAAGISRSPAGRRSSPPGSCRPRASSSPAPSPPARRPRPGSRGSRWRCCPRPAPGIRRRLSNRRDPQLFQGGGDLGIGHGPILPSPQAIFRSLFRVPNSIEARCPQSETGPARAGPSHLQRGRERRGLRRRGAGKRPPRARADRRRRLPRRHRGARRGWRRGTERPRAAPDARRARPRLRAGFRHALTAGRPDPRDGLRLLARPGRPAGRWWRPQRADVVLGSRYVAGGGVADWGPVRRAISRGGSAYARSCSASTCAT